MATSSRLATSSVVEDEVVRSSADSTSQHRTGYNFPLLHLPRIDYPLPSLPPVAVPAPVAPPDITTRPAPTRSQPADGASTRNHNGFSPLVVQGLAGGDGSTRPRKRQRTAEEEPLPPPPSPEEVAATLGRCLEDQVFPHIERATAQLSPGIYDLDKLGARVIRQIVDKDFEHHFHQGNGRLSSSRELIIAAGVHRLVIELSASHEYRLPIQNAPSAFDATAPAAIVATLAATSSITAGVVSAVPVPRIVLPSIENDVDEDDEDDGKDEEDDGSDDDHSDEEDGYDASDHGLDVGPDLDANLYIGVDDNDHEHPSLTKAAPQPRPRTPRLPRPPQTQERKKTKKELVSPQQLRARAKANQWQSGKPYPLEASKRQFRLSELLQRPYRPALERQQIAAGVARALLPFRSSDHLPDQVIHVDFCESEIDYLQYVARALYGKPVIEGARSSTRDLRNVLKKVPTIRPRLAEIHAQGYNDYRAPPVSLTKRSSTDIANFLDDLYSKQLNEFPGFMSLSCEYVNSIAQSEAKRASQIPALLLSREITGNRLGAARTYFNFQTTAKSNREDYLEPQVEWTNCAGDIMTVSWLSNTDFICGTTTHSDSHNQQYNKPGNLLLGSAATNILRAYPDHRIIRPVVSSGDNALESMIASQDPWLFTSVVSSDYSPSCGLAFTSSFDKTVKVWRPDGNGSMVAYGTWAHNGHVNFVVAAKNSTGKTFMDKVATAADVPTEAVRVYHLDQSDISASPYDSYSCTRVHDEDYVPSDKWAYYPAAIRWGLAPSVQHCLLIGYSPRSPTGEDHEIPEDKRNTGELCLWDTMTGKQQSITSAKTQNVFEVAWHPSRASFAAATSASKALERTDHLCRTQIRIFEYNRESCIYSAMKTLDCAAIDINELSVMPNCHLYSYVAASCTDGNVYVWDTAGSDLPMCILEHGDPVEELLGEREIEDVGVKFTAWATTADRLYTGSSDGVVKVWNIRHGKGVLVKDLIEVAAPITYGAFSPDFTRLAIGDGSGRVYLLALEDTEDEDAANPAGNSAGFLNVETSNGNQRAVRRPRPYLPHPEVPPPDASPSGGNKLMEGQERARAYLNTGQLVRHPDPTIGVMQGPIYTSTGLFRAEAHVEEDPTKPLQATFRSQQQDRKPPTRPASFFPSRSGISNATSPDSSERTHELIKKPDDDDDDDNHFHEQQPDLKDILDPGTLLDLRKERAELDDRLIDLDYETSILDSEEDEDDHERHVEN